MSNTSFVSPLVDPATAGLPDQRPLILTLAVVFMILATVSTAARFHARKIKGLGFESDDWTCLVALICCIGFCVTAILNVVLGNLGWHIIFDDQGLPVDLDTFTSFGKATFTLEFIIWPTVGLTKISVLLLYKRIFGINKMFRILIWVLIGLIVAWTIAFTFSLPFACLPISSNWDPTIASTCVDKQTLYTWAVASDVATDGLILFLPIYNIWKLQLPITRKISIIGIFMLGGLVTVTGLIRAHYLTLIYDDLAEPNFDDVPYVFAPTAYWSVIECCTGIVCACLPTLMPLLERYRINTIGSRLLSTFGRSTGSASTITESGNGKRHYEDPRSGRRSHSSKDRFWNRFFCISSGNDTSSLTSLTQLTDIRAPKSEV